MDQWILDSLQDLLPYSIPQILHDHVLAPDARLQSLKHQTTDLARRAVAAMWPVLGPLLDRLVRALHDSPDVVVLAFFLVLVLLVAQALSWLSRAMMFWTRLAMRLLFWAGIVALGAVVWQRGFITTFNDVVDIGGRVASYAAALRDVWVSEYHKYEAQTKGRGSASGSRFDPSRGR